jgi:hypothetical protein
MCSTVQTAVGFTAKVFSSFNAVPVLFQQKTILDRADIQHLQIQLIAKK